MDPNPFDERQLFMTRSDLIARGWTRSLIKRFLPFPDLCLPVNHWKNYAGQDAYARSRIWHIEQSRDFELCFYKSWSRRLSQEAIMAKIEMMRTDEYPASLLFSREEIRLRTMAAGAAKYLELAAKRRVRT